MKPPQTTRILLVDDHEVVRRGLRALLENRPEFQVCGEAVDGREAIELAEKECPDIVVMDITMPGLNGVEATRRTCQMLPQTKVVILSMHHSEQIVRETIAAGACAYVLKSDAGRDLLRAIAAARDGQTFFSQNVPTQALTALGSLTSPAGGKPSPLTDRETEVMQLLAEGRSTKEIASLLQISVKTAETHRTRILRKLKMNSIADLVRYAIRNHYVEI